VAEPWLSADDIAAHLGVTKDTVYTWIAEKAMPAHKALRPGERFARFEPPLTLCRWHPIS